LQKEALALLVRAVARPAARGQPAQAVLFCKKEPENLHS
jgi:hypothetical protein